MKHIEKQVSYSSYLYGLIGLILVGKMAIMGLPVYADSFNGNQNRKDQPIADYIVGLSTYIERQGSIPLHRAALQGDQLLVTQWLLEGEDINRTDAQGATALLFAIFGGHKQLAAFLIKKGACVNCYLNNHCTLTPLGVAAILANANTRQEIVTLLIENGVDVNQQNIKGNTALHAAVEGGHLDIVMLLIQCGANIRLSNKKGYTPVSLAIEKGRFSVAYFLERYNEENRERALSPL